MSSQKSVQETLRKMQNCSPDHKGVDAFCSVFVRKQVGAAVR